MTGSYPAGSMVTENLAALFKLRVILIFHVTKPLLQCHFNTLDINMVNFEQ